MTGPHDDNPRRTLRQIVAYLEATPAVTVNGQDYAGTYLSSLVGIRPDALHYEATITPQVIFELGRLRALAKRELDRANLQYRIWRDSVVFGLTNEVRTAIAAGFECAANPGVDAKGKAKPPKCPSTTAAEQYLRKLPEYARHWEAIGAHEEAWAVMDAGFQAANERTWAVKVQGGLDGHRVAPGSDNHQSEPGPEYEPQPAYQEAPAPPPIPPTSDNPPPPPPIPGDSPKSAGMKTPTAGPPGPPPPPPNRTRS